jgi:hypothetical protein
MPFVADAIMDLSLTELATSNQLHVCSQEPVSYVEATATYTLGNAVPSIGAPADRAPNGRKVTVGAIASGTVTANGTATHWALVKTGTSTLMATGVLGTSGAVTIGTPFSLAAFDLGLPDAI